MEEKRITFEVSSKFHKELKRRCAIKGVTIKEYIINAIEYYQVDKENHLPEFKR